MLRILIVIIFLLVLILAIIPKTTKDKDLERKIMRIVGSFTFLAIAIFIFALYQNRTTLFKDDLSNHPVLQTLQARYDTQTKLDLNQYDFRNFNHQLFLTAFEKNQTITHLTLSDLDQAALKTTIDLLGKVTPLTTLELIQIQASQLEQLFNALTHNKKLSTLICRQCRITPENMQALGSMLQTTPQLVHLYLQDSKVDYLDIKYWLDAAKQLTTLHSLELMNNDLDERSAPLLSQIISQQTELTDLNLSGNQLEDTGLNQILQTLVAVNKIEKLNIGFNQSTPSGIDSMLQSISQLSALQVLNINRIQITESQAMRLIEYFRRHPTFNTLYLRSNLLSRDFKLEIQAQQQEFPKKSLVVGN